MKYPKNLTINTNPNEFIFCGFVDFAKGINSNAFLNKTISEQNNQITEQNKQIIL